MTTLAELQKYLTIGMTNPEPSDLLIGETTFCTFRNFDEADPEKFMWVAVLDKDKDLGSNTKYKVNIEGEGPVWVEAKFFWTKAQVQAIAEGKVLYVPRWEKNFTLPDGVVIKDPQAFIQAALNMMRDSKVMGRRGATNLAAVKCDVDGLCLGHFYKLGEALGQEACDALNAEKT